MPISTGSSVQDASSCAAAEPAKRVTSVAYAAFGWVVVFFAFHVYWYFSGSFANPGKLPATPHVLLAWIVGLVVTSAFPLGALVCLAIARGWARGRLAAPTAAAVRLGTVLLFVRGGSGFLDDLIRAIGLSTRGITGLSIEEATGHAHLRWTDWAIDGYFVLGGISFVLLAVALRAQSTHGRRRRGRGQAALPALPSPPANVTVPAWCERLAHAIPLLVVPSGLWRLAVAFGFPMGMLDDAGGPAVVRGWAALYVALISLVSEAVSLSAFALVRPWGEMAPGWLPFVGGRPVRRELAVAAATAGSVALMLIWTWGFWDVWTGDQARRMSSQFWAAVFAGCYAPLNLWGPALLMLTWAYHRRTSGQIDGVTAPTPELNGERC